MRRRAVVVMLAAVTSAGGCAQASGGAPSTTTPSTARPASTAPASTASAVAAPAAASPVDHLRGVGRAQQVVEVTTGRYGSTYATLTAWRKTSSGWRRVLGPWSARIGRGGFAPPGRKREGDGRTPTGSYGFSFFFGVAPRPSGIRYPWRHAYTVDVWDDDSSSSRYNLWTDTRHQYAGRDPEPMHVQPAYDDGAVIAYNTARRPGLGSAIFLHVSHNSATAGCVSLPRSELLRVLRWLDPRLSPRIIMGTTSAITR